MRVLLASTSLLALPTIGALEESEHELVGVLTKPDAKQGRGRELLPNELAVALGDRYRVWKVSKHSEIENTLNNLAPDIVVTISFGTLIKSAALSIPRFGWVNIHFSLLPKYRGAAPVQWAIRNGESSTGISIFQLDEGMDTGPVYLKNEVALSGKETSGELLDSLSRLGATSLVRSLEMITSGVAPIPQSGDYSLAPKITKNDARIDWSKSAASIDRLVRAMHPEPLAWSEFRSFRVRIGSVELSDQSGRPGELLDLDDLTVATGDGAIRIKEIQPEGKRMMSTQEWLRGARLSISDTFT